MFIMKEIPGRGLVYKTSRISYISNYLIITLIIVLFILLMPYLKFNLNPRTFQEYLPTLIAFGFLILTVGLLEQPFIEQWMRQYIITNNEIIKKEGIVRKKRITIPFQNVADVKLEKGVTGRIFNFGNIHVASFNKENSILMKGVRNPEEIHNIIQNKISLMRKAIIRRKPM